MRWKKMETIKFINSTTSKKYSINTIDDLFDSMIASVYDFLNDCGYWDTNGKCPEIDKADQIDKIKWLLGDIVYNHNGGDVLEIMETIEHRVI
jgi:hypothetical protein